VDYSLRFTLALTVTAACYGQSISLGAIGGARLTDDVTGAGAISASKGYVVGPALAIGLPLGFGLEADALYRRQGYQAEGGNIFGSSFEDERANSWEFPLLASYRLPEGKLKPFLEIGFAARVIHGSVTYTSVCYYCLGLSPQPIIGHGSYRINWPQSKGIVVGGGVTFRAGRLQLAPTVRYTHWNNAAVSGYFGDGASWQSAQDQADLLVGISWRIR
jgi:hypothetical protein